jgi:hypothetical protein
VAQTHSPETIARDETDVNAIGGGQGEGATALGIAAKEGHEAVVRALLECPRTDREASGICGTTPCQIAFHKGWAECARLLAPAADAEVQKAPLLAIKRRSASLFKIRHKNRQGEGSCGT